MNSPDIKEGGVIADTKDQSHYKSNVVSDNTQYETENKNTQYETGNENTQSGMKKCRSTPKEIGIDSHINDLDNKPDISKNSKNEVAVQVKPLHIIKNQNIDVSMSNPDFGSPIPKKGQNINNNSDMGSWFTIPVQDPNQSIRTEDDESIDYGRMSAISKVYSVYESPFNFMRQYTIFPSTRHRLQTRFVPFYPLTASLACFILTNQYLSVFHGFPVLLIAVCVSSPFCVLVWFIQKKIPHIQIFIYMPLSLIMTIIWINAPANQVIHVIYFISEHLSINKILLGGTVIAIGNSLSGIFFFCKIKITFQILLWLKWVMG